MDSLSLAIIVIHAQFSRRLACYSCYVHGSKVRSRVHSSLTRPVVEILLGPVPRQCPSGNFDPRTILSNPATGPESIQTPFFRARGGACRMNEQTTRDANFLIILLTLTLAWFSFNDKQQLHGDQYISFDISVGEYEYGKLRIFETIVLTIFLTGNKWVKISETLIFETKRNDRPCGIKY